MSLQKILVKQFYDDIWNRYDKSAIPQLLTESVRFRGSLGQETRGREGFIQYLGQVHASLAGYQCDIREMICEGNRVAAVVEFSGIHRAALLGFAPTGKSVRWVGCAWFSFQDALISDIWVLGDLYGLCAQLQAANERC